MSDFRSLAHLEEHIGRPRFRALIDSANTGKVREFCDVVLGAGHSVEGSLPAEITVGARTYEILPILREGEESIAIGDLLKRAKRLEANLGAEDAAYIMGYASDIPANVLDRVFLLFPEWYEENGLYTYALEGDDLAAAKYWRVELGHICKKEHVGKFRLLRRKEYRPIRSDLPTEFTVGNRTYAPVPFLYRGEWFVDGKTMLKRAHQLNARAVDMDGGYILDHQNEIPESLRRMRLLCADWLEDGITGEVVNALGVLDLKGGVWQKLSNSIQKTPFDESYLLLRRLDW